MERDLTVFVTWTIPMCPPIGSKVSRNWWIAWLMLALNTDWLATSRIMFMVINKLNILPCQLTTNNQQIAKCNRCIMVSSVEMKYRREKARVTFSKLRNPFKSRCPLRTKLKLLKCFVIFASISRWSHVRTTFTN